MKGADTNDALTRFLLHRAINLFKAEWHYALSHLGIVRFSHLPVFVSIEPAACCNLHCPECPVGNPSLREGATGYKPRLMPMPLFERILQQVKPFVHTMQFFFQGEPTLHPDLPEMIRLARLEGIHTIVSTNANALTATMAEALVDAGLNRIIVSADGLSETSYRAYRQGGSLQKALEGLRYLREAKNRLRAHTHIELQCLRLKTNEHEWQLFKERYKTLGADSLTFKTAQLYDYRQGHPLMPSHPRHCRYRKGKDGIWHLHRPWWRTKICHRLFTGCVIDTAGNVLPCCFDKNGRYPFGNLQQQPFADVWQSPSAKSFRNEALHHRAAIGICNNCTE